MEEHQNYVQQSPIQNQSNLFAKVFLWMFMGLFATGLISWFTYSMGIVESVLTPNSFTILLIAELVVVVLFSALFKKLSPMGVSILFFVYAVISGITISTIFYVYELTSIVYVLFASAALFGIFALIGSKTKLDLSKISPILFGGLIIAIIVSIINIIVGNNIVDIAISWVVLILFFGITAYDMQKIKMLAQTSSIPQDKVHIYGAMQLYLDFINIFLRVLSLFGKRK